MADQSSVVVAAGGTLACSHGGTVTLSTASIRLKVGASPAAAMGVLLAGQESGISFAAGTPPCANVTTDNPPKPAICTSAAATAGLSTKLKVGAQFVLLTTATGTTTPSNTPAKPPLTWSVAGRGQGKLKVV